MGLKVMDIQFKFEEGIPKLKVWAEKYAINQQALDELGDVFSFAVKVLFNKIMGAETNLFDIGKKLKDWSNKHALADSAINELAEILDFIIDFGGIAGAFLEIADGKLFKWALKQI